MPRGKSQSQPQLKAQDLYEELRDKGQSKQKAARISNAAANRGRSSVARSGGHSPSYEDWTVTELQKRAKELDLHGYSKLNKAQLIDKLRNH